MKAAPHRRLRLMKIYIPLEKETKLSILKDFTSEKQLPNNNFPEVKQGGTEAEATVS